MPMYIAPIWSWMNVDGPVVTDSRYYDEMDNCALLVKVVRVSVSSEHASGLHSFVAASLVLRGVAMLARASWRGQFMNRVDQSRWAFEFPCIYDDHSHQGLAEYEVELNWDENLSSSEQDPIRWPSLLEERNSEILCMFVYVNIEYCSVNGLVLRKLPRAGANAVYVRMGSFESFDETLAGLLATKLGYSSGGEILEDIDLDKAADLGLVHEVTVV